MANGRDDIAMLATDLATSPLLLTRPVDGLEPEHYTTRGYEQLIADAAAARRLRVAARA